LDRTETTGIAWIQTQIENQHEGSSTTALLPMAEFQYNNHDHASTRQSPFMLDTGQHPQMGFKPHQPPLHLESVNKFKERMEESLHEAGVALAKAKDDMSTDYNHRRERAPTSALGDKVYLDASDIHTTCPSQKLAHRQLALCCRVLGWAAGLLPLPS
jgi:hypothetical protein